MDCLNGYTRVTRLNTPHLNKKLITVGRLKMIYTPNMKINQHSFLNTPKHRVWSNLMSKLFLITAHIIIRLGGLKLSGLSHIQSVDTMNTEWNDAIGDIDDPKERLCTAYNLIPDSISMTMRFGYIGRWIKFIENKPNPKLRKCLCKKA